ncbi:MAG: lytic murein transglycosylase [Pseudomonadota bacterium]
MHRSCFRPARAGVLTLFVFVGSSLVFQLASADATHAKTNCKPSGSFSSWKRSFRQVVRKNGISERTIRRAYDPITYDPAVIRRDRRQSFFSLSFLEFSKRLVSNHRIRKGGSKLKQRAQLFRRAEKRFGVPGPVITAFWALESDFGIGLKKQYLIFNALGTLAYDCRRPELFGEQLIAALKLVDSGRVPYKRMVGSWAGEIGETQFLPSHVLDHAVDGDGDGAIDLYNSDADVVFSTAAFIRHLGWRTGEPWLEEVRIPKRMRWREADLTILHPRAQWAEWGVRRRNGRALPNDRLPASLLLPMGRNGPAFLAYRNFRIYPEWNKSLNYAITAAYLATRLAGAPRYAAGNGPIETFSYQNIKQIQQLLNRNGFDTGGVDGKLGAKSRAAIKAAQLRFGLPADSYPSAALVRRLRRGS